MAEVLGSMPILLLDFFFVFHCKAPDANIAIIANFGYFVKNSNRKTLYSRTLVIPEQYVPPPPSHQTVDNKIGGKRNQCKTWNFGENCKVQCPIL